MYCFKPSHTYFLSPHLLDKFKSTIPIILILHNKHFFFLQNFYLEELVDMLTCNLSKIMHNVWLQQSGKKGAYLYVVTSNENVWTFKQLNLYFYFKHGGWPGQRCDRTEVFLRITTRSKDPKQLADAILKYSLGSIYTIRITHMEGEEILALANERWTYPLNQKGIHIGMIVWIFFILV